MIEAIGVGMSRRSHMSREIRDPTNGELNHKDLQRAHAVVCKQGGSKLGIQTTQKIDLRFVSRAFTPRTLQHHREPGLFRQAHLLKRVEKTRGLKDLHLSAYTDTQLRSLCFCSRAYLRPVQSSAAAPPSSASSTSALPVCSCLVISDLLCYC